MMTEKALPDFCADQVRVLMDGDEAVPVWTEEKPAPKKPAAEKFWDKHDEPLTPHPLFDFSGGAGHARGAGGTATLRLSSSGTVWAPHLDHSFNHVLQLHGEKAWSLFQFNQA